MKRFSVLLLLLALLLVPAPAYAEDGGSYWLLQPSDPSTVRSHGMMQSDACGTYTWKADLTKGRTDSLVIHAVHTEGCFTYDYTNYAPAGIGEVQGNSWQGNYCVTEGQKDVARHFDYYRHTKIDPSSVRVTCDRYSGPD